MQTVNEKMCFCVQSLADLNVISCFKSHSFMLKSTKCFSLCRHVFVSADLACSYHCHAEALHHNALCILSELSELHQIV